MIYSQRPSADNRAKRRLRKVIAQLSQNSGIDSLEPHAAIGSVKKQPPATEILRQLSAHRRKTSLTATHIEYGNQHLSRLRQALRRDRALMLQRARIAMNAPAGEGKSARYQPQITSLHAKLSAAKRVQMARQIPMHLLSCTTGSKLQLLFAERPSASSPLVEHQKVGAAY